jgi:hypothetical protein
MKKIFISIILFLLVASAANAQEYMPYSYQFYQKLDADMYSTKTREHTSFKSYLPDDSLLKRSYDSLMNIGFVNKSNDPLLKKLFNEHQVDYKGSNATFYADFLPEITAGRDFSGKQNLSSESIGLQLGGTVGKKFYYYVSGYVSTAVLPEYLSTYVNDVGVIPGQAYAKIYKPNGYDWQYITAVASYSPNKFLNISAGRDKTFIGDGYRSLLLSDFASPYPFFKLTATLGNVRYMAMWTDMNDPALNSQYGIFRKKFGVFHYLDYTVNNRLSLGFFENVTGFFTDDNGQKRNFDLNYVNPLIFLNPVNNNSDDPDKSLLGFTGKYKLTDGITVYGQFALNEFRAADIFSGDGSFANKYGFQLGVRGANLFGIKGLNYLLENNNAKPYTYSARSEIENYSENGEPLAHPFGANFRELVGLLNYSYKRFDFSAEGDLARYGFDMNGLNFGKNIFEIYTNPARVEGNYTTQGLTTNMVYFEGKVAYLVNPKYNLRLELGAIARDERNTQYNDKAVIITFGIKSSFRQVYNDLASFKPHAAGFPN